VVEDETSEEILEGEILLDKCMTQFATSVAKIARYHSGPAATSQSFAAIALKRKMAVATVVAIDHLTEDPAYAVNLRAALGREAFTC